MYLNNCCFCKSFLLENIFLDLPNLGYIRVQLFTWSGFCAFSDKIRMAIIIIIIKTHFKYSDGTFISFNPFMHTSGL